MQPDVNEFSSSIARVGANTLTEHRAHLVDEGPNLRPEGAILDCVKDCNDRMFHPVWPGGTQCFIRLRQVEPAGQFYNDHPCKP